MKPAKKSSKLSKLSDELISLIPSLDEEGLSFLVEQARVLLRNMEIDRLNAELDETDAAPGNSGKKRAAGKPAGKPVQANFRIERSPSGSSYHVISGGKWKMFTDEEMLAMVNICSSDDDLRDVAYRLHSWLDRERLDAFADLEIGDKHDPKMIELVELLRKKFKVRKR